MSSVDNALANLDKLVGQGVGSGQCYAVAALYEHYVNPDSTVGLGGGINGISGLIGDGLAAAEIGHAYNWAANGWTVIDNPTSVAQIPRGAIITYRVGGTHITGQGAVDPTYGHVGVVYGNDGTNLHVYEQNLGGVERIERVVGSNISGILSVVIPPNTGTVKVPKTTNKLLAAQGETFLDVASYQPGDLTQLIQGAGTNKTIIKATEGTKYLNPNLNSQTHTSIPIGFYHFARFGGDVKAAGAEAEFFLGHIPAGHDGLLAVCDYEDDASGDSRANTEAILAFMRRAKEAGYKPVLYTYTSYLPYIQLDRILGEFPDSLWEAWYSTLGAKYRVETEYIPNLSGKAFAWQFSSNWKGLNVDVNYCLKNVFGLGTVVEDDVEEDETLEDEMNKYNNMVVRSKSGKEGYVAITNGKRWGVSSIDTVQALIKIGYSEVSLGDADFGKFLKHFPTE